jgi:thiol:disulfide interchange protein DsbD
MGAWLYPEGAASARRAVGAALLVVALSLTRIAGADAAGPKVDAEWRNPSGGGAGELTLSVTLESGWHVNANDPDRPYLIPTTLEVAAPEGTKIESIRYPDAVVQGLAFAPDTKLRLYHGSFPIRVKIAGGIPARFDATLSYQACNDEKCLPPTSIAVPYEAPK